MAPKIASTLLSLAVLASCSQVQLRDSFTDSDDDKKPWKEVEAQLPPYPKAENLIRLNTGTATPHSFYIDTSSISLGDDGVVRYTVVTRTSGGATNVTFEGMRCETRQQKLYAIGRAGEKWVQARDAQWQRVVLKDLTPHHYTLYQEYFCPQRTRPTPPRQAVDALKRGVGLQPRSE
jgi:hypothetical protein